MLRTKNDTEQVYRKPYVNLDHQKDYNYSLKYNKIIWKLLQESFSCIYAKQDVKRVLLYLVKGFSLSYVLYPISRSHDIGREKGELTTESLDCKPKHGTRFPF